MARARWHYIWVDRNFDQPDREEIIFTAEKGTVTILTPVWPSQPWWPRILALAVALPLWIPFHPENIIVPSDDSKVARVRIRFDLVGWSISNNSAKRKAFRGRRLKRLSKASAKIEDGSTILHGCVGWASLQQATRVAARHTWKQLHSQTS